MDNIFLCIHVTLIHFIFSGEYEQAIQQCSVALEMSIAHGATDRSAAPHLISGCLGVAHQHLNHHSEAVAYFVDSPLNMK